MTMRPLDQAAQFVLTCTLGRVGHVRLKGINWRGWKNLAAYRRYFVLLASLAGHLITRDLRQRLFTHLQAVTLRQHSQMEVGEIAYRLQSDASFLDQLIVRGALPLFFSIMTLGVMFASLARIDPLLALGVAQHRPGAVRVGTGGERVVSGLVPSGLTPSNRDCPRVCTKPFRRSGWSTSSHQESDEAGRFAGLLVAEGTHATLLQDSPFYP